MLTEYSKKSIRWLLQEKYGYSDLDINEFFNNSEPENIQGWVLAKPSQKSVLSRAAKEDINRVLQGEPVDYIIGFKYFLDCKIDLSLKPLIPRVETEFWVGRVIENLIKVKANLEVLDIFCGSGCIGISVLKHTNNSLVTFADISKKCIEQTRINTKENKIESTKYKLNQSDVFKNVNGKFDIIFANPPYVPNHFVELSKDLFYEPKVALAGGSSGLEIIHKFLTKLPSFLKNKGVCYMEFGDNQEKEIEKLLESLNILNYVFKKDQFGVTRYVQLTL